MEIVSGFDIVVMIRRQPSGLPCELPSLAVLRRAPISPATRELKPLFSPHNGSLQCYAAFTAMRDEVMIAQPMTAANPARISARLGAIATVAAAFAISAALPGAAQNLQRGPQEIAFKEVAPNLYFLFDFQSSNAVVFVTDEGVLVIDTRQHPREGQDLLDRIRKVTDKPVRWVINSHFHGDHHYGNSAFKAAGATIVAHTDTARLMSQVWDKELARRGNFFRSRNFDPKEVTLVQPDVTFDQSLTIRLGGKEVRLLYLGPGQQAGDTFVLFPEHRILFTPGAFGTRSMPNMAFTPSVENWIKLLGEIAAMDLVAILPAHGDVAKTTDVKELADFLADEYATIKEAIAKGVTLDQALKTVTLDKYKDWRNYQRREQEIRSLYELIQTGKRGYFE
jgi:glyoxylase-like metal-dependent hydrolase (beta-lactamase superfamily II)